jgi:hypothetical protein
MNHQRFETMKTLIARFLSFACVASLASAHAAGIVVANNQGVDATLGLSASKTYTHKLDFPADGSGATVNGVTFSAVGAGSGTDPLTGNPYSLLMDAPANFTAHGDGLLLDFIHNASRPAGAVETVSLGGLVPGTTYDVRLYYRNFGPRAQDVTIDTDGVPGAELTTVMDQATGANENYWSIVFQADSPTITIRIAQRVFNASWHQYAISSEVVPGPANTPVTITAQPQNVFARMGGRATFRVAASGSDPITFQWRKAGIPIADATNMVYSIAAVSAADAASYDVVVSNLAGAPATSASATLTVGPEYDLTAVKVPAVQINGIAGRNVALEQTSTLGTGPWNTLTNVTLNANGTAIVVDRHAPENSPRFYRAQQQQ